MEEKPKMPVWILVISILFLVFITFMPIGFFKLFAWIHESLFKHEQVWLYHIESYAYMLVFLPAVAFCLYLFLSQKKGVVLALTAVYLVVSLIAFPSHEQLDEEGIYIKKALEKEHFVSWDKIKTVEMSSQVVGNEKFAIYFHFYNAKKERIDVEWENIDSVIQTIEGLKTKGKVVVPLGLTGERKKALHEQFEQEEAEAIQSLFTENETNG